VEVERLQREYNVEVRWAPYLLNPSIPPEGKKCEPQTNEDTPKSHLELMGEARGVTFKRGRTFTPNSHKALEAAEFAYAHGLDTDDFHRALFKANFEDFENIGDMDVLLRIASENGIDSDGLRQALDSGEFTEQVDTQIEWARSVGVTGIPTFIFDDKYALVGAQEFDAFEQVMATLKDERAGGEDAAGAGS